MNAHSQITTVNPTESPRVARVRELLSLGWTKARVGNDPLVNVSDATVGRWARRYSIPCISRSERMLELRKTIPWIEARRRMAERRQREAAYRVKARPPSEMTKIRAKEAAALKTDEHASPSIAHVPGFLSLKIRAIQELCGNAYGVAVSEIIGSRRGLCIIVPRHTAIYLCFEFRLCSKCALGRWFGNRDHSTVYHAIRAVKTRMANEPDYAELIAKLKAMAEAAAP